MNKKIILAVLSAVSLFKSGILYPTIMQVTDLDYKRDIVEVTTSTGFVYEFYGTEDYYINDLVAVVMFNNGTPNTITDDAIIAARYGGWWVTEK